MGRRSRLKKKLKTLLPAVTVTVTTVPFVVWSPPAQAFFPPMWPVSPPTTINVVPPAVPPIVVPPVPPPPFVPPVVVPPPVVPPVIVPPPDVPPIVVPPPPPPTGTPEPATVVSSLIGLAAAAGYGLRRRQKGAEGAGDEVADGPKAE